MRFNKWYLFVFLCLFASTISAQKLLEKPYTKWSKEEAMKILSESPWAKTYQNPDSAAAAASQQAQQEQRQGANSGGSNPRSVERNFGAPPVVIRLHSALPIRQAIVRLQQLQANYDKMSEEARAKFDANAKNFLDCPICKNYYVVTITKAPEANGQRVDEGLFQRMELKDLKGNVTLVNDAGVRRELIQFTPPKGSGDSAVFFFQRADDKGEMLLTPQNKELKFLFKNDFLTTSNPYSIYVPKNFEFKVSKMVVGENLMF